MEDTKSLSPTANVQDVAFHFDKSRMNQMLAMASEFFKSGCFSKDVANPHQALIKIQAGFELGMSPMESMSSFYIVNGKLTLWGPAMAKKLKEAGYKIQYADKASEGGDPLECTVTVTKGADEVYTYTATAQELKKMNSKAFGFAPKEKLRYHAISRILRFELPEVLSTNLYYTGEAEEEVQGDYGVQVLEYISFEDMLLRVQDAGADALEKLKKIIPDQQYTPDEFQKLRQAVVARQNGLSNPEATEPPAKDEEVTDAEVVDTEVDKKVDRKEPELEKAEPEEKKKEPTKKPIADPAKHYTEAKVKEYCKKFTSHHEVRGLKEEMNRLFSDGEITEAAYRDAIRVCQDKETELNLEERKAQGKQASIPDNS